MTKKYVMNILNYEMHGIQRFPAMWYDYPNHNMEDVNLSRYEIDIGLVSRSNCDGSDGKS